MGANEAGVYYLAFTLTTIGAILGRLGLDNALIRFTSASQAQSNTSAVRGVYWRAVSIAFFGSGVVALIIYGSSPWIAKEIFSSPDLIFPLQLMSPAVVFFSLLSVQGKFLRGLNRIRTSIVVLNVGLHALFLVLLVGLGWHLGVEGVVLAYVLATLSLLSIGAYLVSTEVPGLYVDSGDFSLRRFIRTSLPLFAVAVTGLIIDWTDTLLLGFFSSDATVGVYSIALRVANLSAVFLTAFNTITGPKFAGLYEEGGDQELRILAQRTTLFLVVLTAPLIAIFVAFPEVLLSVFGSEFVVGAAALQVLAIGQLMKVGLGPVGNLLAMTGNESVLRNTAIATATLNVALNFALIPIFGMVGAAIGTAASFSAQNLTEAWMVRRRLGFHMIPNPSKISSLVKD